jgi:ABC-type phosphate transport system auxiliary subunit
MRDIKEIFSRIQQQKKEQREINRSIKDALSVHAEYHDIAEQIDRLKLKKRQIENSLRSEYEQKIDLLKLNIKGDVQTMSDIALASLVKGESINLKDDENNEYEPVFSVRFKKMNGNSFNYDTGEPDKKQKEE